MRPVWIGLAVAVVLAIILIAVTGVPHTVPPSPR
jgi:hypothetical protein